MSFTYIPRSAPESLQALIPSLRADNSFSLTFLEVECQRETLFRGVGLKITTWRSKYVMGNLGCKKVAMGPKFRRCNSNFIL